jgi:hypothetical protein
LKYYHDEKKMKCRAVIDLNELKACREEEGVLILQLQAEEVRLKSEDPNLSERWMYCFSTFLSGAQALASVAESSEGVSVVEKAARHASEI